MSEATHAQPQPVRLGRSEAARLAGCSIASIRRAEQLGELAFEVDEGGVHWFDRAAIERWVARKKKPHANPIEIPRTAQTQDPKRPRVDMKVAAVAYERFEQGARPIDVATELQLSGEIVCDLFRDWRTLGRLDGDTVMGQRIVATNQELDSLRQEIGNLMNRLSTAEATISHIIRVAVPPRVLCDCGCSTQPWILIGCSYCGREYECGGGK